MITTCSLSLGYINMTTKKKTLLAIVLAEMWPFKLLAYLNSFVRIIHEINIGQNRTLIRKVDLVIGLEIAAAVRLFLLWACPLRPFDRIQHFDVFYLILGTRYPVFTACTVFGSGPQPNGVV